MSGRILIGENSATHVCLSFTRQMRVGQHKKKLGRIETSSICRQQSANKLLCRSHTPTWLGQHKLANKNLSCEGRLTVLSCCNTCCLCDHFTHLFFFSFLSFFLFFVFFVRFSEDYTFAWPVMEGPCGRTRENIKAHLNGFNICFNMYPFNTLLNQMLGAFEQVVQHCWKCTKMLKACWIKFKLV